MMAKSLLLLVLAASASAGCAPKNTGPAAQGPSSQGQKGSAPEDEAPTLDVLGGCKSDGLQRHVGKTLTTALADQMKKEAGAMMLRTAHENAMITMDYHSGRLNIFYNDTNAIVRVDCG